jgi:hypothetical protein
MTQQDRVLIHLKKNRSITGLEALGLYGCYRLSDCIFKLRGKGHKIDTELVEREAGKPYARYRLRSAR